MSKDAETAVCARCGAPAGVDDVVVTSALSDSLVVSECATCGTVVRIGGHPW